jgi:uncharacterized membrane protein YraQ (UPF0718 family)
MSENPPPERASRPLFDWSFAVVAGMSGLALLYVWRRDGTDVVREIFGEDLLLLLEILPKVLAGTLIGALIQILVPRSSIVRWLGAGSGWTGLLIATTAGLLIPAGPFTVFPIAASLLLAGADRGTTVAFISGWLLLGLNRALIWEMPFFGTDIVLLRSAFSIWMPFAVGWGVRRFPVRSKLDPIP